MTQSRNNTQPPVRHVAVAEVPELPDATWSNCLQLGKEIVTSGMTARPASLKAVQSGTPLNTYEQAMVVLHKIAAMAEAAGGHIGHIYRLTVYVTEIADKDAIGQARRDFFGAQSVYPVSTLVEVSALVFPELKVEMEAAINLDIDLRALNKMT